MLQRINNDAIKYGKCRQCEHDVSNEDISCRRANGFREIHAGRGAGPEDKRRYR